MKTAEARRPPTPEDQKKAADAWNAAHPVGSVVSVELDDGTKLTTKTESPATILASGVAVVWVRGISGCYKLDRVKPATAPDPATEHTAVELLKATRQILAEYETDGALQIQAKAIDDFFANQTVRTITITRDENYQFIVNDRYGEHRFEQTKNFLKYLMQRFDEQDKRIGEFAAGTFNVHFAQLTI